MLTDYCTGLWFAVQVRARCEKGVASVLNDKGYEVFAPEYPRSACLSYLQQPTGRYLLPGYLFVKFDHTIKPRILSTYNVIRIVGNGRCPVPVPNHEIESIRRLIRSEAVITQWPYLKVGQRIRIMGGPLDGIEGIFLRDRGKGRLVVSVHLLERSVSTEVNSSAVIICIAEHYSDEHGSDKGMKKATGKRSAAAGVVAPAGASAKLTAEARSGLSAIAGPSAFQTTSASSWSRRSGPWAG